MHWMQITTNQYHRAQIQASARSHSLWSLKRIHVLLLPTVVAPAVLCLRPHPCRICPLVTLRLPSVSFFLSGTGMIGLKVHPENQDKFLFLKLTLLLFWGSWYVLGEPLLNSKKHSQVLEIRSRSCWCYLPMTPCFSSKKVFFKVYHV